LARPDYDADGVLDADERAHGTDPYDPLSHRSGSWIRILEAPPLSLNGVGSPGNDSREIRGKSEIKPRCARHSGLGLSSKEDRK